MKPLFFALFAAFLCPISSLPAAELPAVPVLRIEAGVHTAMIRRISADGAGRLALTVSHDKTARLWELPGGRLLRVLRPPLGEGNEGKLYAGALSPDGALAALGGFTGESGKPGTASVYLFDTATGRLVRRLSGLPSVTFDLAFSAKGRFLAAGLGGGQGLRLWEVASGKEVGRDDDYGERDSHGVDWFGEELLVTTCDDGNLRLYEVGPASTSVSSITNAGPQGRLALRAKAPVRGGPLPYSARFSPNGRWIAVGFGKWTKVIVMDGQDLRFLFMPDTAGVDGQLACVSWTDDGAALVAAGSWYRDDGCPILLWPQEGQGHPQVRGAGRNSITDLRPLPGGRILFGTGDPAFGIAQKVSSAGGSSMLLGAPPLADYRGDNTVSHFRISSDGASVAFGYEQFGKAPAWFSLPTRELKVGAALNRSSESQAGLKAPRLSGLKVTDWKNTTAPKLAGQPLSLERYERSRSLAIARDASLSSSARNTGSAATRPRARNAGRRPCRASSGR